MRPGDTGSRRSRVGSRVLVVAAGCLWACTTAAGAEDSMATAEPHHHAEVQTVRTLVAYSVPDLTLVRDDGRSVSLRRELDDGPPVILDFIYTTCTTVCPMSSRTLVQVQRLLGADGTRIHLASISIDPEQDTPERLAAYARQFHAGPQWRQYTGSLEASLEAQRSFGVYGGDKMGHNPVTLLRVAPGRDWVRFDGFVTADELVRELRPPQAVR